MSGRFESGKQEPRATAIEQIVGPGAKTRKARSQLIAAILFALLALPFLAIAGEGLLLRTFGTTTNAAVIEATYSDRIASSPNPTWASPYELQYEFHLPGSRHSYRYWESTIGMTQRAWKAAKRTGEIRVVYLPFNPWINLPEDASPLYGVVCPSVAAVTAALISLAYLLTYVRSGRTAKSVRTLAGAE